MKSRQPGGWSFFLFLDKSDGADYWVSGESSRLLPKSSTLLSPAAPRGNCKHDWLVVGCTANHKEKNGLGFFCFPPKPLERPPLWKKYERFPDAIHLSWDFCAKPPVGRLPTFLKWKWVLSSGEVFLLAVGCGAASGGDRGFPVLWRFCMEQHKRENESMLWGKSCHILPDQSPGAIGSPLKQLPRFFWNIYLYRLVGHYGSVKIKESWSEISE